MAVHVIAGAGHGLGLRTQLLTWSRVHQVCLPAKMCGGEVLAHFESMSDWNGLLSCLSLKIHRMSVSEGTKGGVRGHGMSAWATLRCEGCCPTIQEVQVWVLHRESRMTHLYDPGLGY